MILQVEYSVMFPRMENNVTEKRVTFSIEHMKSREPCVVYHVLHAYNPDDTEILVKNKPVYIGTRWVVTKNWESFHESYNLSKDIMNHASYFKIELRMIGVDDNNPCYFTNCMFKNGGKGEYHETDGTLKNVYVNFINNAYVNLYSADHDGAYLQVIRPNMDYFSTYTLRNSNCSVLVPHLAEEVEEDKPFNVFMEYMTQVEQTTNIYHSGFKM